MITCPHCQHENLTGSLACSECHAVFSITAGEVIETRKVTSSRDFSPKSKLKATSFSSGVKLFLHVEDEFDPVFLPFTDSGVMLGRAVKVTDTLIFDLTPYGAVEKGVSRKHAVLQKKTGGVVLIDNKSSNGTHLNGEQVHPQQPYLLHDGDELYLGKLRIQVCFKQTESLPRMDNCLP